MNFSIDEPAAIGLTVNSQSAECGVNNGQASVSVSGGTPPYSYLWSPGNQTTPTIGNLGAGSYTVTVVDGNGCSESATVNVSTVDGPNVVVDFVNHETCFNQNDGSAGVSISGGELPYLINWLPSGGSAVTASNLAPGNYSVEVTDNTGCTVTTSVTINPASEITLSPTIQAADCGESNGSIALDVSGGNPPYSFQWTPNLGTTSNLVNLTAGLYTVSIQDNNGCEVSASYTVGENFGFDVSIVPSDPVIESGESVQLGLIIQSGIVPESYSWSPSSGLSCVNCPNPLANPNETTTYFVTVIDQNGCIGQDSVTVFVTSPCVDLALPTIFSPNGDGNNDEFCILGNCIQSAQLTIYNRWGEVVFNSVGNGECWDGTHRDKPVNTGVFVYKLRAILTDGTELLETGSVTLVR